jgi:hypothetical protein
LILQNKCPGLHAVLYACCHHKPSSEKVSLFGLLVCKKHHLHMNTPKSQIARIFMLATFLDKREQMLKMFVLVIFIVPYTNH